MIYPEPRYRLAGEQHLLMELGDEVSLVNNLKAIALAKKMIDSSEFGLKGIKAITDAIPSFTTVLIQYNPRFVFLDGLIEYCNYCWQQLDNIEEITVPSRLIEIAVNYNDRWSQACYREYCQTIKPIEPNLELVARLNNINSLEELIAYHSHPEWWVGALGFVAGLPTLMPLADDFCLQAPKYDPPRMWTPPGTIGVAGSLTTIYPVVIPDGYQMMGRTPVPIFDLKQTLQPFQDSPFLFRIGDRVKFRPICEEEFEAIEKEVETGKYQYSITAEETFSLKHYLNKSSERPSVVAYANGVLDREKQLVK